VTAARATAHKSIQRERISGNADAPAVAIVFTLSDEVETRRRRQLQPRAARLEAAPNGVASVIGGRAAAEPQRYGGGRRRRRIEAAHGTETRRPVARLRRQAATLAQHGLQPSATGVVVMATDERRDARADVICRHGYEHRTVFDIKYRMARKKVSHYRIANKSY